MEISVLTGRMTWEEGGGWVESWEGWVLLEGHTQRNENGRLHQRP